MKTPLYTVSIVVHNRLDLTARCLRSVLRCSPLERTEIFVWDNASTDGTEKYLRAVSDKPLYIRAIRSPSNIGFGEAHNRVAEHACGTYLVILNNDTEVCPGWLGAMRQPFLDDPRVGLVGIAGGCSELRADGTGMPGAKAEYAEGACLMIPLALARSEGLFLPEFRFMFCEDVDLSLRLRQTGWRIRLVDLPVKHLRSATTQDVGLREKVTGPDLAGYHAYNHAVLRRKWARYLERRSFEERILIRRGGALGDVLLLTPILRALKRRNAEARIDVGTGCPQVLANNPDAKFMQPNAPLPEENIYDSIFDLNLSYERTPRQHIIASYAEACGLDPQAIDWKLRVYPDAAATARAKELRQQMGRYAVLHPGITAWPGRNWHRDRFVEVAERLHAEGWGIVVVGNHATPKLESLDAKGIPVRRIISRPFLEVAAVIAHAGLFVGLDSFPLHLAQAALIPTVGIFGLIDPRYRLLPFPFIRAARHERLGCLGCHHEQPAPRTEGVCLRDRDYCMENLAAETVWEKIQEALEAVKMFQEASKIRERIYKYIQEGSGIDIGCGQDKIAPNCIGFDDDPSGTVDVLGDARKMEFADGQFDWVFSSHCLEDIIDTEAALREWLRILRTGGKIVLYVPHPELYKGCNLEHRHPGFRPGELSAMLEGLGCFVLEAFVDDGPDRYSTCVVAEKR